VSAVGVTLCGAPVVPSRGEVPFCFPSGQGRSLRWRVDLGDIHPSGEIRELRAAGLLPGRITYMASVWTRANTDIPAGTDLTGWLTAALKQQGGGDSGNPAASDEQSQHGGPASWKDPL
jgi:hypothetical protein